MPGSGPEADVWPPGSSTRTATRPRSAWSSRPSSTATSCSPSWPSSAPCPRWASTTPSRDGRSVGASRPGGRGEGTARRDGGKGLSPAGRRPAALQPGRLHRGGHHASRACRLHKEAVEGRGGAGLLRQSRRVPAQRLSRVVSVGARTGPPPAAVAPSSKIPSLLLGTAAAHHIVLCPPKGPTGAVWPQPPVSPCPHCVGRVRPAQGHLWPAAVSLCPSGCGLEPRPSPSPSPRHPLKAQLSPGAGIAPPAGTGTSPAPPQRDPAVPAAT